MTLGWKKWLRDRSCKKIEVARRQKRQDDISIQIVETRRFNLYWNTQLIRLKCINNEQKLPKGPVGIKGVSKNIELGHNTGIIGQTNEIKVVDAFYGFSQAKKLGLKIFQGVQVTYFTKLIKAYSYSVYVKKGAQ